MIRAKRIFRVRPKILEVFALLDHFQGVEMLAFKELVEKHDSFHVVESDLQELQDQASRIGKLGTDIVFKVKELSEMNKYLDSQLFVINEKVSGTFSGNLLHLQDFLAIRSLTFFYRTCCR